MRSKRLAAAAAAAAALALVPAATAGMMHPQLAAHLSGMGETGIVNLTAHSNTHRLCWKFQLHVMHPLGATVRDKHGMIVAQGVLTARGGATSHAAVVARQIGKPCVSGCEALKVDAERRVFTADGRTVKEGEEISINGTTGEVILGAVPLIEPTMSDELKTLLSWADGARRL